MRTVLILALAVGLAAPVLAQEVPLSALRATPSLTEEPEPPRFALQVEETTRRVRNYPEQPPIIPHSIEGYQLDVNFNKCLSCHARTAVEVSQAPMVSITHFMDRDGQFLAAVSPRRYFCTQCHVPQHDVEPPIANTFLDIEDVLQAADAVR